MQLDGKIGSILVTVIISLSMFFMQGCQSLKHQPEIDDNNFYDATEQTYSGNAFDNSKKTAEQEPSSAETNYAMGFAYYEKQNYDKAIESYKKAIELKPDDVEALIAIGFAYAMKQDYDKAIESWKEAIKYKPDNTALLYYNIGDAYGRKGDETKEREYKLKAEN